LVVDIFRMAGQPFGLRAKKHLEHANDAEKSAAGASLPRPLPQATPRNMSFGLSYKHALGLFAGAAFGTAYIRMFVLNRLYFAGCFLYSFSCWGFGWLRPI
jgi:hypothetical protein